MPVRHHLHHAVRRTVQPHGHYAFRQGGPTAKISRRAGRRPHGHARLDDAESELRTVVARMVGGNAKARLHAHAHERARDLARERAAHVHVVFGLKQPVDVGKLREREHNEPWDDSLAKKIVTDNPLARDYVDYLLGRVVCCAHVSQLRKHRTSITEEGMLYQGYVARPIRKALMDDAFIGRAAIGIRSARLENELNSLRENLHALSPLYEEIEKSKNREFLFSMRFVSDEITQRQRDYLRGLEIVRDLDKVEDELLHLDLFWLDSKREEIKTLEKELTGLRKQETGCTSDIAVLKDRIHEIEYEKLPDLYQTMIAKEDKISEQFTDQFVQATGIPRYQAELKRLKKSAVVAKNFGDRLVQTENEQRAARDSLFRARSAYIQAYQPCSFAVDSPLNDEFAGELSILEESELPKYREKIKEARESALEQFQNDFLYSVCSTITFLARAARFCPEI